MAIGTKSDFVIYNDQFHSGMNEVLNQNTSVFNGASRNGIILTPNRVLGDYGKESFYSLTSGFLQDRDPTSTSAATATKLTQAENISVKINKMALMENTLDSFKKKQIDMREFSFVCGQMYGQEVLVDYIKSGVGAAAAAIGQHNVQNNDTGTITTAGLVQLVSKLGDASNNIVCFVMHSKTYFDLVQEQIAADVFDVGGINIKQGTPVTLNRPVIVTDSTSLISSGTGPGSPQTDEYYTLALTPNAIRIDESEERTMYSQIVGRLDNLLLSWQVESAYNLSLKGYKWDTTNGGANPSLSALTTATNWDKVATSTKDLLGAVLVTQ